MSTATADPALPPTDRRERPYLEVALLVGLALLAAVNLFSLTVGVPAQIGPRNCQNCCIEGGVSCAENSDLRLYYAAARLGEQFGWSRLYDPHVQPLVLHEVAPGGGALPFVSPPELAWLMVPLTPFRFDRAYGWCVILAFVALVAAAALAPAAGLRTRLGHGLLLFGTPAATNALSFVNVVAFVPLAVLGTVRLLRSRHQILAGVVLALAYLKPQVVLLCGPVLLLAGYRRAFWAWLAAAALLAATALGSLGPEGTRQYLAVLRSVSGRPIEQQATAFWWVGGGLLGWVYDLAIVAIVGVTAWRRREDRPELPFASALLGSLLVAHYLNRLDWLIAIVAIWLAFRARPELGWLYGFAAGGVVCFYLYPPLALIPLTLVLVGLALPPGYVRSRERAPAGTHHKGLTAAAPTT